MSHRDTEHLRVLIANERKDRLALVAPIVVALGHEVIAREIDVKDVGAVTAREPPEVALVGLGKGLGRERHAGCHADHDAQRQADHRADCDGGAHAASMTAGAGQGQVSM